MGNSGQQDVPLAGDESWPAIAPKAGSALPPVSVVVPLHNCEAWVEEALVSVLRQDYPPTKLEIIVVDDGSDDEGAQRAASTLAHADVPYEIIRQPNSGPSRARNVGWRAARNEWIQFLDSDDLLSPDKIAGQAGPALAAGPDVAVVYSPWQRLSQEANGWRPSGQVEDPRIRAGCELECLLSPDGFLQVGCLLVRRQWLERVGGFDETRALIEDVDMLLRIAIAGGRFLRVPSGRPLAFYRQTGPGSLSQRDPGRFVAGCICNAQLAERYWRSHSQLTWPRAEVLSNVYFHAARHVAAVGGPEHRSLVDKVASLTPGFVPPRPARLRLLSRAIGYRRAESAASAYRRMKVPLRGATAAFRDRLRQPARGRTTRDHTDLYHERQRHFWNIDSPEAARFERVYVEGDPTEDGWRRYIERTLGDILPGISPEREWHVLDLGCGVGRVIGALRERTPLTRFTGVDLSDTMIRFARERLGNDPAIALYVNNGRDLSPVLTESVDFAYSVDVFIHISDYNVVAGYLREVRRVLKPGATFRFNLRALFPDESFSSSAGGRAAKLLHRLALISPGRHRWSPADEAEFNGNCFTEREVRLLIAESGLALRELRATRREGGQFWCSAQRPSAPEAQ